MSDVPVVHECACCEQPLTGGFVRLWPDTNLRICYDCIDWMNSQRTRQIERSGGGAVRVVGHEPVFRVVDVALAVGHYERLGFRTEYHDDAYAFASFGALTVHLAREPAAWPGYQPDRHMTSVLYIHVEDADRLAADWRAVGATVTGPGDEDYGKREGQHVDPDGNLIRFGSPISD